MSDELPVFRFELEPALVRALSEAAARVIESRRYVLGPEVEQFEREFAAYCGSPHCVGVANGTDSIELALRAIGVTAGDRVVTTANAGGYTATALHAIGAQPLFVDVGEDLVMSPFALDRSLDGVRAVVVTHLYGRMAAVGEIVERASAAGVPVVEDCAQAHGAHIDGKSAGTFGALGCFSFYPTKNLGALGDAGAILTADSAAATRMRALRQYGWDNKYHVAHEGGRNSRLDEMQAAFLRVKLPFLRGWTAARTAIALRYCAGLRGAPVRVPQWRGGEYVAHLFVIRCTDRDALRAHLSRAGIGTDIHYPIADHMQAAARRDGVRLPVTEAACDEVLSLPCFPGMRETDVDRVVAAVRDHYEGSGHG
ncbi:MAG: DegT/DnrJ/EryC1/StrS family aminotransferase [Betaproteobacteria bacterium]